MMINTETQYRRWIRREGWAWHAASQRFHKWPTYGDSTGLSNANSMYCAKKAHERGLAMFGRSMRRKFKKINSMA